MKWRKRRGGGHTCGLGGSLVSNEQPHCGRCWAGEGDREREIERRRYREGGGGGVEEDGEDNEKTSRISMKPRV